MRVIDPRMQINLPLQKKHLVLTDGSPYIDLDQMQRYNFDRIALVGLHVQCQFDSTKWPNSNFLDKTKLSYILEQTIGLYSHSHGKYVLELYILSILEIILSTITSLDTHLVVIWKTHHQF